MRKKGKTTVWLGSPDVAISGPRMSRKKACPALDAGWAPVFRKDHAPTKIHRNRAGRPLAAMTSVTDDLRLAADFPQATQDDWRKLVDGVLKGAPFEKLTGKTYDGLKIEPIYPRAERREPRRRPRGGCTLADHAADRSSGSCEGQCDRSARSRKRRHRARDRVPGRTRARAVSALPMRRRRR